MDKVQVLMNKRSADSKLVGFDYQFYYFVYLLTKLKQGDNIGFEVKDDIHIDHSNGTLELIQIKHTVQTNTNGEPQNLTDKDIDLWKTISGWIDLIDAVEDKGKFLSNTSFRLITNKGIGYNTFETNRHNLINEKISSDDFLNYLDGLVKKRDKIDEEEKTDKVDSYIKNIKKIDRKWLIPFFSNVSFLPNEDNIINMIKEEIFQKCYNKKRSELIFHYLYSSLEEAKYLEIKERNKFQISFDEYAKKFANRCYAIGVDKTILPRRDFELILPNNINDQTFVRQLIDIGETLEDEDIITYTTEMLQAYNNIQYWIDNDLILATEDKQFKTNTIKRWNNTFKKAYREIEEKLKMSIIDDNIDENIKRIALEMIDSMRLLALKINNVDLDLDLSNGYLYLLSDEPSIGWHFHWKEKYMKKESDEK